MGSCGLSFSRNRPSDGAAIPADKRMGSVGVALAKSLAGSPADSPAVFQVTARMRRALEPSSPRTTSTSVTSAPGAPAASCAVSHSGVMASPCQGTSSAAQAWRLLQAVPKRVGRETAARWQCVRGQSHHATHLPLPFPLPTVLIRTQVTSSPAAGNADPSQCERIFYTALQ